MVGGGCGDYVVLLDVVFFGLFDFVFVVFDYEYVFYGLLFVVVVVGEGLVDGWFEC